MERSITVNHSDPREDFRISDILDQPCNSPAQTPRDEKCADDETYVIKQLICKKNHELVVYNKKIKEIKNTISRLKKQLYDACDHKFIRDHSAASDDIFKYRCANCELYNNY